MRAASMPTCIALMEVSSSIHVVRTLCSQHLRASDNNDGITVFDLTDPENPRYCHTGQNEARLGYHELLDSVQYTRTYYYERDSQGRAVHPLDDRDEETFTGDEKIVKEIADMMEGEQLITPVEIGETWTGRWCSNTHPYRSRSRRDTDFSNQSLEVTAAAALGVASDALKLSMIPSLAEMSCKLAIDHALCTEDASTFERLALFPTYLHMLQARLLSLDRIPDAALSVFALLLQDHGGTLDLSKAPLSGPQLDLLFAQAEMKNIDTIHTLDLSYLPGLDQEIILSLIHQLPGLRNLCLWGKGITIEELLTISAASPSMHAIAHPALFKDNPRRWSMMPAVLSMIMFNSSRNILNGASTHSLSPRTLLNVLAMFIPATTKAWSLDSDQFMAVLGCHMEMSNGDSWNRRTITHLAHLKTNAKPDDESDDDSCYEPSSGSGSPSSSDPDSDFSSSSDPGRVTDSDRVHGIDTVPQSATCPKSGRKSESRYKAPSLSDSGSDFGSQSGSDSTSPSESVGRHMFMHLLDPDPIPERPIPTALLGEGWTWIIDQLGHKCWSIGFVKFSTPTPSSPPSPLSSLVHAQNSLGQHRRIAKIDKLGLCGTTYTLREFVRTYSDTSNVGSSVDMGLTEEDITALEAKIDGTNIPRLDYHDREIFPLRWMTQLDLEQWIEKFERQRMEAMRRWARNNGYKAEERNDDSNDKDENEDEDESGVPDEDPDEGEGDMSIQ
jgi:hypothetical protein